MAVGLSLVSRMVMVVRPMFPRVLMVVHMRAALVGMVMTVLVQVFVSVGVGVFVNVRFAAVSMLMAVLVSMLVGVQMPVFVLSFHLDFSFPWVDELFMSSLAFVIFLNPDSPKFKASTTRAGLRTASMQTGHKGLPRARFVFRHSVGRAGPLTPIMGAVIHNSGSTLFGLSSPSMAFGASGPTPLQQRSS